MYSRYKTSLSLNKNNFKKYDSVLSNKIIGAHKIQPFFSIIIPTYKRLTLLKDAIFSALNQNNFNNYEVLIVDNDDTDTYFVEIKNLVISFSSDKLIYYKNANNIGMFGNWNRGIELAKGQWIIILCDDDVLLPDYLSTYFEFLSDSSRIINRLESKYIQFNTPQELHSIRYRIRTRFFALSKLSLKRNLVGARYYIQSVCLKRKLVVNLGGIDDTFYPSADWFLIFKYDMLNGHAYKLNRTLSAYRWGQNETLKYQVRLGFVKDYIRFMTVIFSNGIYKGRLNKFIFTCCKKVIYNNYIINFRKKNYQLILQRIVVKIYGAIYK